MFFILELQTKFDNGTFDIIVNNVATSLDILLTEPNTKINLNQCYTKIFINDLCLSQLFWIICIA